MKKRELYRVAISDWSPQCFFCRVDELGPGERLEGDYCPYCQYTYNSLAEVGEYADATVSYHETKAEADAIQASLVPYRICREEDRGAYTISAHISGVLQNSPEFLGEAWNVEYSTLEEAIDVALDLEASLEDSGLPLSTAYDVLQDGGSTVAWSSES